MADERGTAIAATVFVVLAAFCWGLSGGIGGILIAEGWDAYLVAFYRGVIGLLFVLGWLAVHPQRTGLSDKWLWIWSAVAGLGVAGNFTFYFLSISQGSVAIAATLMYCAPVFVFLVSFALRLETPSVRKWIAISLVMVGIVLLTRVYDAGAADVTLLGVAAGLLAGACYALFIFGFKYAAPHGSPPAILAIAFAVLATVLIWPSAAGQVTAVLAAPELPLFIALGVLGAGLSFILYVVGLSETAPAVAAIVAMIEPVTASLFGVLVLSESLTATQLIGMALILLTVTALSVRASN
ncbi:DMT family transporter [Lentisalinibacter salinarum]|uniref:DMT family transporter n=1 Tax=Lentisalinibacter salinarum TaxID=2992239 RepID=UPI00386BDFCB